MPYSEYERAVLSEVVRRKNAKHYLDDLFPLQRAVIDDKSKRKTVRCGRRAGKTKMLSRKQIAAVERNPGGISLYGALSRPTAERLLWGELKRVNLTYDLGMTFNDTKLEARHPNGGQIWLAGADDKKEREKLRGHAFVNVDLDEAASFGIYLDYLIEEVLEPAMEDYDGEICLAGSPGAACAGLFFEADTGVAPGWTNHHWTVLDNEKFPRWVGKADWKARAAAWLDARKAQKHWADDSPVLLREWLGLWIKDLGSLVYRWDAARNGCDALPDRDDWEYVLGIDLGYVDATALVVGAFSRELPDFYAVEQHRLHGITVSDVADKVDSLRNDYRFTSIVADTGGLGKMVVEEMKKRHKLPIRPAEKTAKFDFIEHMNADMVSGHIKAPRDSELARQWEIIQYDEDRKKEDPRFPNDVADAALYCWREARHYLHQPKEELPPRGTAAYYDHEAERMKKVALARVSGRTGRDKPADFMGKA